MNPISHPSRANPIVHRQKHRQHREMLWRKLEQRACALTPQPASDNVC